MAIAFDNQNSTSSGAGVSSLTTTSWAIGGTNRYLVAGVFSAAVTPVNPSNVKWGGSGGTALTQLGSTLNGTSGQTKLSQWTLLAPTVQSSTLFCDWASTQDETALGGVSYTGVDQATPLGTQATAQSSSSSVNPTATVNASSAAQELVTDVVLIGNVSVSGFVGITVGAGQTSRVEIDNVGSAGFQGFGMSEEAGAASVTMSWTSDTGGQLAEWMIFAVPLKPSSANPIVDVVRPAPIIDGQANIVITGSAFGAAQGAGTVKISPTNNVADAGAISQTVTAWAAGSITFTAVRSTLGQGVLYLFVTENGGLSNTTGYPIVFIGTSKLAWYKA